MIWLLSLCLSPQHNLVSGQVLRCARRRLRRVFLWDVNSFQEVVRKHCRVFHRGAGCSDWHTASTQRRCWYRWRKVSYWMSPWMHGGGVGEEGTEKGSLEYGHDLTQWSTVRAGCAAAELKQRSVPQVTSSFLAWVIWHVMGHETHPLSSKLLEGRDHILLVQCHILWAPHRSLPMVIKANTCTVLTTKFWELCLY